MTNPLKWLTQVSASKPAIFEEGLDAYSQKITNVAAGVGNTDAVNYGQLTDQSSSLKNYIDIADQSLQTNINNASSSLKSYADAADTTLQTNINNVSSSIVSYVDAADNALQNNLNNVSSSLVSYTDAAVQVAENNITAFSSSMKSYVDAADTTLQNNINTASSSLKSYIDAADAALQQNINNASSSIATSITAEQTARMSADEQLLKLDGSRSMSGDLNMGLQDITNAGSASFAGDLNINGTLQVNGVTTSFNSTEVQVTDKLITIANGSADAAAANGAGLEVDGAGVSLTYDSASNKWVSDIGLSITNEASFDSAIKLSGSNFTNITTAITGGKYDLNDAIRSMDTQQSYILTNLGKGYDALRYTTTGSFSSTSVKTSAYLDGNGDYLNMPDAYNVITTGSFTLEAWIYRNSSAERQCIIGTFNWSGGNNSGWLLNLKSNGQISLGGANGNYNESYDAYFSSQAILTSSLTCSLNEWTHVAITRDGSDTLRIFINGQEAGSTSYSYSLNREGGSGGNVKQLKIGAWISDNSPMTVYGGSYGGPFNYFSGYIDDVRITQGVARYTSNFVPPTSELSLTGDAYAANVALLLNMNGTENSTVFTDSSNNAYAITAVGNAKLSSTQAKYGPDGEVDVVTVTLPAFFTSSMIDTVALDVMVDQGAGWTNDLVSGKMYPSGSFIKVDINAPAVQDGDKYRLIAVGNASIADGIIYNVTSTASNNGTLAGGTIVYAFNEVAVGSTIVGSPVNYSPKWSQISGQETNLNLISIDSNGIYGNSYRFGTDQFGGCTPGTFEGHPGLGSSPTSNAAMAADLNMNIFTYSCTVDVWLKPIVVYPYASWDMPFFKIGGMGYSRDNWGNTSYGDGMFIRLVDQTINNEHCWVPQAICGWPAHGAGVQVDASSLGVNGIATKDIWTHIAVRKTVTSDPFYSSGVGVTLEIFVNGEKATGATGEHFHYDNAALSWGIKPDYYLIGWEGNRPGFQGSMDQLRISDSALSDAEILAIYQAGSASLAAGGGAAGPGAYSSPASSGVGSGGLQGALGNNPTSEWASKICDNLNPVGGVIIFNKGSYWC